MTIVTRTAGATVTVRMGGREVELTCTRCGLQIVQPLRAPIAER